MIDDKFSRKQVKVRRDAFWLRSVGSWWHEAWAVGGRHESRKKESVNTAPVLAREMLFKCRW